MNIINLHFVESRKLIEGFGVDIPQLLEVLESDKF